MIVRLLWLDRFSLCGFHLCRSTLMALVTLIHSTCVFAYEPYDAFACRQCSRAYEADLNLN
jgi:hypothetical protein